MEELQTQQFMSPEINEISAALSAFQGSIKQPNLNKEVKVQTKQGGTYKFKYADLSACMTVAALPLKENKLGVVQIICGQKLITLLTHSSGQWFRSELDIRLNQNANYQDFGSAITYLKRYSLCAILGIVADADDDGNLACGNSAEFTETSKGKKTTDFAYTGEQLAQALGELENIKSATEYNDLWQKWVKDCPALCKKGTEFYNACATKASELNNV